MSENNVGPAVDELVPVDAVDTAAAADKSGWKTVQSKRDRQRHNQTHVNQTLVVGTSDSGELDVADVAPVRRRFKWLHVSSFRNTVSAANIIDYVVKHANIDEKLVACYKLVKKDADMDSLNYVNFKLGVSGDDYKKVLKPELWPAKVTICPFRFFQKTGNKRGKLSWLIAYAYI